MEFKKIEEELYSRDKSRKLKVILTRKGLPTKGVLTSAQIKDARMEVSIAIGLLRGEHDRDVRKKAKWVQKVLSERHKGDERGF